MPIRFRPARADDAAAAVPLIYSSGPAAFDYVFGRAGADAQGFLLRAFVDGAGEFGHRNHRVGELDARIIAVGAGFGAGQAVAFTLAAARQIVAHFGWRAAGPVLRGLRAERVIRPPARGEHYLAHLGVEPAHRGRGFGAALVAELLEEGRRQACAWAALDVAVDNPRAQALYGRLGFRVQVERGSVLRNAHGAVPAHRRMRRALAGDVSRADAP